MLQRNEYLSKLIKWKHEKLIKVVTGIRRCGKSTLLKLFENYLKDNGVNDSQIISINFEDLQFEELRDYKVLYKYICEKLCKDQWNYILLDEIQNVANFQRVVDSLYVQDKVDIYITGSNAYTLSGDLATLLSGRYIEISMLPLSFKEYYELNGNLTKDDAFARYLKNGGFPYTAVMNNDEKIEDYLEGIYNTIIVKDVEERQNRSNKDINFDVALLKSITRYLADVIGNPVSIKGITDYLNSNNRKVSDHTVSTYVTALTAAFIFYPVERYNIQGKEILKTNKKFYIVDVGLRNHLITKRNLDLGFMLENIVYLELIRRNYKVNVGKVGDKEIDFVVQKNGVTEYFQVSANVSDEKTFAREISPLESVKDNYKKTILTLDKFTTGNYNGILVENAIDWLLQ